MIECLISPAEREPIISLGTISSLPETKGADILWGVPGGLAGLQRKQYMDLVASVRDGRLGRELMQMQSLSAAFLCIEGQAAWSADGHLQTQYGQWTMKQQWGIELSIQRHGIQVLRTRSALETCTLVEYLVEHTQKEDQGISSLLNRGGPPKNGWGRMDDDATKIHVYSGLPMVGVTLATRIVKAGIKLLVAGTTTEELMTVEGIGRKKAEAIMKAIT